MKVKASKRKIMRVWIMLLVVVFAAVDHSAAQLAEPQIQIRRGFQVAPPVVPPASVSGALLKTDPELEAILEKAERFRQEDQLAIACKLWQTVLERSGDALYSSDDQLYFSLSQRVEDILAGLAVDDGLATYRITADAGARELLSQASGPFDERTLKQIVRRFFMSSWGDDAALTLSSIYLDRHDFVGAYRMLRKIVEHYPDPDVSLVDVQTRMALCLHMMGEPENAAAAIEQARSLAGDSVNSTVLAVAARIDDGSVNQYEQTVRQGYRLVLANRLRNGLMPSPPDSLMQGELQAVWQYYFPPDTRRWPDVKRIQPLVGTDLAEVAATVTSREKKAIDNWRSQMWRPAGDLLFDRGQVYFKTAVDLTVWSQDANSDRVLWRPLWRNEYEPDDFTSANDRFRRAMRRSRIRTTPRYEVQLFKDRIASQMSIQEEILYSIEGQRFDNLPDESTTRSNLLRFNYQPRRSRSNHLTAYDARSGRLLWTLPPLDSESDQVPDREVESPWLQSGGFMSAPIHYAGLAIVPVNQSGAIFIYALDPMQDGKTVWKSYLCDESDSGANPYSPINLSINGSDLFASCGLGAVFILDPATGLIRFAKRYPRRGKINMTTGRFGRGMQQIQFESWSSDTVLAYGRQMICFSSDARNIEAHDRNSGELIWRSDVSPLEAKVDYLLGLYDGVLYAAGSETILAFDLRQEGRMVWGGKRLFGGKLSYGRGMLTPDGIYVPVDDSICKYSLTGRGGDAVLLGKVNVDLGTGAPVGNLYSDGQKIWVHGANRIYALARGMRKIRSESN